MPILGILASSTRVAAGDFESIATVTVGSGGSSSVTFSSIGSGFTHLQIRGFARSTRATTGDYVGIRLNTDTSANYSQHSVYGDGSAVTATGAANTSQMNASNIAAANANSSVFGALVIDILDYANTNKYKTVKTLIGYDNNGSGLLGLASGSWRNTNAITSITLINDATWAQYSHFALYGIKSA